MNQILQVSDKKQLKPISTKKIILFLLIILFIAGLSAGGYYIYINGFNWSMELPIFIQKPEEIATITLAKIDRNKVIINVQSEKGIEKVRYSLNNEEQKDIELISDNFVEETVDMPVGENTISILVIDMEGKEITKQETFVVEAPRPVIDLSVVGNDIKITVTSEVELKEITYKWNSDNEKKENMITYEDRLLFEKLLEIPIGQNTLKVVAIDVNGEKTEKVQEIKGVTKTTTTTEVIGEYIHFTVTAKENIEKVEFEFNGQKYLMNTDTFGKTKTVHYKVKLENGMNYLTIKGITQSGGVDVITWQGEYTK